jgi:hypothetical protein
MYSYTMTPLDLYKLPDLDKRAISGAASVYIYPASGRRAVQLVQSVSEARWTLTVGHTDLSLLFYYLSFNSFSYFMYSYIYIFRNHRLITLFTTVLILYVGR